MTQRILNWGDVAHMLQQSESGYDKDAVQDAHGHPHFHGSPGAEVQDEKERRAGIDSGQRISQRRSYDWRTLWLDWPAFAQLGVPGLGDKAMVQDPESGERTRVPIIVDLLPDAQQVARVLPNVYLTSEGTPFFSAYYRRLTTYEDTEVFMQAMMTLNVLKVPDANAAIKTAMDSRKAEGVQIVASNILEGRVRLGAGPRHEAV